MNRDEEIKKIKKQLLYYYMDFIQDYTEEYKPSKEVQEKRNTNEVRNNK